MTTMTAPSQSRPVRPSAWSQLRIFWEGNAQPLLVLLGGFGAALALSAWVATVVDRQVQTRFAQLSERPVSLIQGRLNLYTYGLQGARGVFAANNNQVTRQQFHEYINSRQVNFEFPGVRAWEFIQRIPGAQFDATIARLQAQDPNFHYHGVDGAPHVPGADAYVITMVEPMAGNSQAYGLDVASETRRRQAAVNAMDSAQTALSAPIALVQDRSQAVSMSFLSPVYTSAVAPTTVAERQQQLIGWVSAPLRVRDVLGFLAYDPDLRRHLNLRLSDITDNPQALFELETPRPYNGLQWLTPWTWLNAKLNRSTELDIGGRRLRLDVSARDSLYNGIDRSLPWLTLTLGSLMSIMVAGLIWFYARLRREAEDRAFHMTASLRERESLLKSTLTSLDDWVFVFNEDGVIIDCYEPSRPHHWLPRFAFLGHRLDSLDLPPAARGQLQTAMSQVQRSGKSGCTFDLILDGQQVFFEARLTARLDGEGRYGGVTMVASDISMERQQAQLISESEEKFRLLFAEAAEAIVLIKDGIFLDANPAAMGLFGIATRQSLIGKPVGYTSPARQANEEDSQERLTRLMTDAILAGPQHFEWAFMRQDDQLTVPSEVHLSCIELGGEPHFLAVITDLAARKQTEAALIAARDAAEAATRDKSEFLATMSHEIRTPMNGVLGMAQLLMSTEMNSEQRDYVRTLYNSGQALLGIINDILDFSKIEAGRLTFESIPFDLQSAIEETCELLLPQIRDKKLKMDVVVAPDTPFRVVGDPGRLRQVLLNYLSNAVKFTDQGGIRVGLQVLEQTEQDCLYEISVADSGIGIAPEKLNGLFQRFSQADASTTRRFGGTGLGLAITKALVECMGGNVNAASTPGTGSTFRASFRLQKDHRPVAAPTLRPELHGNLVLVVDDVPSNRMILSSGLGKQGLNVLEADSVSGALEAVRSLRPRFVILDAELPDGNVSDLLHTLHEAGINDAAYIFLSSRPEYGDHAFCRENGIAAYLPKPARMEWLIHTLNLLTDPHNRHDLITRQQLQERDSHDTRQELPALKSDLRVLLAEDNAVNQKVAARMLEKLGCKVDTVGNGLEAVVMASQFPYDIVLMDVQMPEMDGIAASKALRAQGLARLPIIALTANSQESDRRLCLSAGMNDFLAKPIRQEGLAACLQRWT